MFRPYDDPLIVETCNLPLLINIDVFDVLFVSFSAITPAVWYTLC